MAELTAFSFRPGHSVLHRIDPRFKLFLIIYISLCMHAASATGLALITAGLALLAAACRFPVLSAAREVRYFALLAFLVFASRSLTEPGTAVFVFWGLEVTASGLAEGGLTAWRLMLVALLGLFLVHSTRSAELKSAVEWFLRPAPFVPERKVGIMLGLTLRFIPLIFDQARLTLQAQRARGVENRKNPVFRLIVFAGPMLRRTMEQADRLAAAMAARNYNEDRTPFELRAGRLDWIALAVAGLTGAAAVWTGLGPG